MCFNPPFLARLDYVVFQVAQPAFDEAGPDEKSVPQPDDGRDSENDHEDQDDIVVHVRPPQEQT